MQPLSSPHPLIRRSADVVLLEAGILAALMIWADWLNTSRDYFSLFALCALIEAAILYRAAREFGLFDARFIFLGVSSLYPFTPVFDIVVLGGRSFDIQHSSLTLVLSMTFFCGFYIFSSLDLGDGRSSRNRPDLIERISYNHLAAFLLMAFLVYLALFYRDLGFSIGTRSRAEFASSASTLFSVVRLGFIVGLVILIAKLRSLQSNTTGDATGARNNERTIWRMVTATTLIAAFLFADVFMLGDRRQFLSFMLAALCVLQPRRVLIPAIALVVLAACLLLYQVVRDFPIGDWPTIILNANILAAISPSNVEFGAFGHVADDILARWPVSGYPTYSDAALTLIPQSLYPDRPEAMSVWFVHVFYPNSWESGGGFGFNLVIEALLNLGWWGPLVLGSLLGLVFNFGVNAADRNRIVQGLLVFALVFAMRFDMVTLLKTLLIVAAAAAAWLIGLRVVASLAQDRSAPIS